jgi:hypothetical protein
MTATPDPNAAEAARLRAAHELLDERPSPGVRAAVLRAAAESARGDSLTEPVRAARRRPARWWLGWQPAAAATVAVGILAVGISVHVEHEGPIASHPETSAAPGAAAPAAPPAPATNAESFSKAREAMPAVIAPPPAPRPPVPADALRATKRDLDRPAEAAPFALRAPGGSPAAAAADSAAQTRASPGPESAGSVSSSLGAAPGPSAERAARLQASPAAALAPPAAAPAAKALLQNRAEPSRPDANADPSQRSASPDDWLRRIIELRRAGRNAEADDELARFRTAFPNVKIPGDALR